MSTAEGGLVGGVLFRLAAEVPPQVREWAPR